MTARLRRRDFLTAGAGTAAISVHLHSLFALCRLGVDKREPLAAAIERLSRETGHRVVSSSIPQELDDLYAIFKNEISDTPAGNVYAGMGNQLQIDGMAYNYLFQALNGYDRVIAAVGEHDHGENQDSIQKQLAITQQAFKKVLENLSWPQYRIQVSAGHIEISGPELLHLHAAVSRHVLLGIENSNSSSGIVALAAGDVISSTHVEVAPGSVRYLLGTIQRDHSGTETLELGAQFASARASRKIGLQVGETGVLQVKLIDARTGRPTAARLRITTEDGLYLPPDAHTYGLILKMFGPEHGQIAQRWFFADGGFQVLAPAGRVKLAIRKGLEFRNQDLAVDVPAGQTIHKTIELPRWIDLEKRGWYAADVHLHYFDPQSVRYEMEVEGLSVANVLVMNHHGAITAREYFRGEPDPVSDEAHWVYYNEEFRNARLGHLGLLNLKTLVEPISTGALGSSQPQLFRSAHFDLFEDDPHVPDAKSPDQLLILAMRETHHQGGLVNWAHLRNDLEFPLDAALGELETVDILTDTEFFEALTLWYHMLNCGLRLAATAGTDRAAPHIPIGHQRVYTRLKAPFTYAEWAEVTSKGESFVTNGPMIEMTVGDFGPGAEISLDEPRTFKLTAQAESQLPFERLEIVLNGDVLRSAKADASGRYARASFEHVVDGPSWIAARAVGSQNPELMYYPHPEWSQPVAAHTSPVYIRYKNALFLSPASARYLLDRMRKLETWAHDEAYFPNSAAKEEALATIARGIGFYQNIAAKG